MRLALLIYYSASWNASIHSVPCWLFTNVRGRMFVTRSGEARTAPVTHPTATYYGSVFWCFHSSVTVNASLWAETLRRSASVSRRVGGQVWNHSRNDAVSHPGKPDPQIMTIWNTGQKYHRFASTLLILYFKTLSTLLMSLSVGPHFFHGPHERGMRRPSSPRYYFSST
jgi:hypothetical protein